MLKSICIVLVLLTPALADESPEPPTGPTCSAATAQYFRNTADLSLFKCLPTVLKAEEEEAKSKIPSQKLRFVVGIALLAAAALYWIAVAVLWCVGQHSKKTLSDLMSCIQYTNVGCEDDDSGTQVLFPYVSIVDEDDGMCIATWQTHQDWKKAGHAVKSTKQSMETRILASLHDIQPFNPDDKNEESCLRCLPNDYEVKARRTVDLMVRKGQDFPIWLSTVPHEFVFELVLLSGNFLVSQVAAENKMFVLYLLALLLVSLITNLIPLLGALAKKCKHTPQAHNEESDGEEESQQVQRVSATYGASLEDVFPSWWCEYKYVPGNIYQGLGTELLKVVLYSVIIVVLCYFYLLSIFHAQTQSGIQERFDWSLPWSLKEKDPTSWTEPLWEAHKADNITKTSWPIPWWAAVFMQLAAPSQMGSNFRNQATLWADIVTAKYQETKLTLKYPKAAWRRLVGEGSTDKVDELNRKYQDAKSECDRAASAAAEAQGDQEAVRLWQAQTNQQTAFTNYSEHVFAAAAPMERAIKTELDQRVRGWRSRVIRAILAYIVNGVVYDMIYYTFPILLLSYSMDQDSLINFVKDAFVVVFITKLDDLDKASPVMICTDKPVVNAAVGRNWDQQNIDVPAPDNTVEQANSNILIAATLTTDELPDYMDVLTTTLVEVCVEPRVGSSSEPRMWDPYEAELAQIRPFYSEAEATRLLSGSVNSRSSLMSQ